MGYTISRQQPECGRWGWWEYTCGYLDRVNHEVRYVSKSYEIFARSAEHVRQQLEPSNCNPYNIRRLKDE